MVLTVIITREMKSFSRLYRRHVIASSSVAEAGRRNQRTYFLLVTSRPRPRTCKRET